MAHDRVGMEVLKEMADLLKHPTEHLYGMANPWFESANEAGIGTSDLANIELVEIG